jgi:hypothetical protein
MPAPGSVAILWFSFAHPSGDLMALRYRRGETHIEALGMKALGGSDPVQRDAIFRIASMTKPVTAAAAMILVEDWFDPGSVIATGGEDSAGNSQQPVNRVRLRWPAAPHDEGAPRHPPPARRRDRPIGAITKAVLMIVLRFLDAVSQGIGICWIIVVLKAAIVRSVYCSPVSRLRPECLHFVSRFVRPEQE